jgi:hypothetical protein
MKIQQLNKVIELLSNIHDGQGLSRTQSYVANQQIRESLSRIEGHLALLEAKRSTSHFKLEPPKPLFYNALPEEHREAERARRAPLLKHPSESDIYHRRQAAEAAENIKKSAYAAAHRDPERTPRQRDYLDNPIQASNRYPFPQPPSKFSDSSSSGSAATASKVGRIPIHMGGSYPIRPVNVPVPIAEENGERVYK